MSPSFCGLEQDQALTPVGGLMIIISHPDWSQIVHVLRARSQAVLDSHAILRQECWT